MKTDAHIAKFRRLDDTLTRLDPSVDRELWIWTAMNAGVHLLNAALHQRGVTYETDSFHTQVEGLYARRDHAGERLVDCVHPPGDVMHVGQPPLERPVPLDIGAASQSLRQIEDLRDSFVRADLIPPPGSEARWRASYDDCVEGLCMVLSIRRR